MIDIHTHVLPGVDDGSDSAEESLKMLSDSQSQGITHCVATPHITVHSTEDIDTFLANRKNSFDVLQAEIEKSSISTPKIILGAEVLLDNDITEFSGIEKLCIENTNLMLVELPTVRFDPHYTDWLYSISVHNIGLILAHVERYDYFDEIIDELEELDVTYQINARTILSSAGKSLAKNLYRSGHRVIISSDTHSTTFRKNHMLEAYEKVKKHKDMASDIFNDYAKQILNI